MPEDRLIEIKSNLNPVQNFINSQFKWQYQITIDSAVLALVIMLIVILGVLRNQILEQLMMSRVGMMISRRKKIVGNRHTDRSNVKFFRQQRL